jgi:aspartate aminotransferase
VVSINSASKSYAMTGWRLGWLAAPHDVAEAAATLKQGLSLHPSTLAQHGALAAITGPQAEFEAMVEAYAERRDAVIDRIAAIPGVSCPRPEGAFYAFVDVSGLSGSSTDVAVRLLDEYGVSATPGEAFGPAGEGHLRLSYANSLERLETGLDRFERLVRDER